jgi:transcriptional regulator with XRE-family HTH domain
MLLGLGNKEIASRLGVTPQTVSDVRNSPIVRDRLALLEASADAEAMDLKAETIRICQGSIKFLEEVQEGMDRGEGAPLHLRVRVAEGFMDRAVPKRVQGEFVHAHLTGEEIEDIKKRAREGGLIVNTTATEVEGGNNDGGEV